MVLITLRPSLARLLISLRERDRNDETNQYLENEIRECRWDKIPPIWVNTKFFVKWIVVWRKKLGMAPNT